MKRRIIIWVLIIFFAFIIILNFRCVGEWIAFSAMKKVREKEWQEQFIKQEFRNCIIRDISTSDSILNVLSIDLDSCENFLHICLPLDFNKFTHVGDTLEKEEGSKEIIIRTKTNLVQIFPFEDCAEKMDFSKRKTGY